MDLFFGKRIATGGYIILKPRVDVTNMWFFISSMSKTFVIEGKLFAGNGNFVVDIVLFFVNFANNYSAMFVIFYELINGAMLPEGMFKISRKPDFLTTFTTGIA